MNDFDSECQYFNDEGFPRGCSGKRKKSSTFYWNQASLRKKKELCEVGLANFLNYLEKESSNSMLALKVEICSAEVMLNCTTWLQR